MNNKQRQRCCASSRKHTDLSSGLHGVRGPANKRQPIRRMASVCLAMLTIGLLTAGCRYTAAPADLLEQPSIASDKQKLVQAVEDALPRYGRLALPHRGGQSEAISLVDVDKDGTDEAIVSYYNEYNTPEIMLFEWKGGDWRTRALIEQPLARQLDWLEISDFDDDGNVEMFVGWTGNGSFDSPNMLEVYRFDQALTINDEGKSVLKAAESMPYIYADSGDANGDGRKELAVITSSGTSEESEYPSYDLSVFQWSKGKLAELQKLRLSSDVNVYDRLVIGRISQRKSGIVVEASTGAHSSYTAMYVWENGKLHFVSPLSPEQEMSWAPVQNKDINGDGIIELALQIVPPGGEELPYSEIMWITDWYQWDSKDKFTKVLSEYNDYAYAFRFLIPKSWAGHYTVSKPEKQDSYGTVQFDYWNEKSGAKAELVSIYIVPQMEWEGYQAARKDRGENPLFVLASGGGLIYAAHMPEETPESLSETDKAAYEKIKLTHEQARQQLVLNQDYESGR